MPVLLLLELGASISEAATAVPSLSTSPLAASVAFTASSIFGANSCYSSRCLKRRMLTQLGRGAISPRPANRRQFGSLNSASSIATSDRSNYC